MRDSAPHKLTERRQAILRQTSAALRGQVVTLWRVARGLAVAEVASRPNPPWDAIESDVAAVLRTWSGRWRPRVFGWYAALTQAAYTWPGSGATYPRRHLPYRAPQPGTVDSRAGRLSLGALERIWAVADQATGYLCGALALLDACLERVRRAQSLTPTARAHLLADLAVIEDAIEGALDAA